MVDCNLRLLVVTSCTGEKRVKSERALIWEDFQDPERLQGKETDLRALAMPAATLYTGAQHSHVMAGVNLLRETFGTNYVDVKILSAGYGLIDEHREVVPYEVTFNDLKLAELDRWSKTLNIREDFEKAIAEYDLIFVLLGERYLRALALPVVTKKEQTLIFFASGKSERYIPPLDGKVFKLVLGNNEAQQFGCALVGLKGFLLERFSHNLKLLPDYLDKVYRYPEFFQTIINQNPKPLQLSLPIILELKPQKIPEKKPLDNIEIPDLPCVQNQHFGLQYYIPEWDDLVDPGYDFLTDSFSLNRKDAYFDQVYAHEIYDRPNYDGILVSKVVIDAKKKKQLLIQEMGIQKFLRFPRQNIMGDCGAFGYIKEDVPPYSTSEIVDFYEQMGFTFGVSIDHLIVGPFAEEGVREKRYELTLKNAAEFLQLHRERGYQFTPIGAVQGWCPDVYAKAVKDYIAMGYDYIGLGGMVRSSNEEILAVLKAVSPHLTAKTRVHLFGVARVETIPAFRHLGVTSMDSASALRRAWLGSGANYHTLSGKKYTAIRIPPVNAVGLRAKKVIQAGFATEKTLKALERSSLQALRDFDANLLGVEAVLEAVLEYDELLDSGISSTKTNQGALVDQIKRRRQHKMLYRELLEDKPWKQCGCKICQGLGIDVVIFRNNNRNRRRGFHNTYVLYKRFTEILNR